MNPSNRSINIVSNEFEFTFEDNQDNTILENQDNNETFVTDGDELIDINDI